MPAGGKKYVQKSTKTAIKKKIKKAGVRTKLKAEKKKVRRSK